MIELFLGLMVAAIAGALHGYTGFGGALVMIPLLSIVWSSVVAVTITIIITFIGQLAVFRQAFDKADWSECMPFLIGCTLALPAGTFLLVTLDAAIMRRAIGLCTLAAALSLSIGWIFKGPRHFFVSGLFGALTGLITGATGQGGPVVVSYFLAAPTEETQQRAAIVATVTGVIFLTLVSLCFHGAVSFEVLGYSVALGLPYLIGVHVGSRAFELVPTKNYRPVMIALLFAAGIAPLI